MNWDVKDIYELDLVDLERVREHHPNCEDTKPIPDGYTPRITHGGARISWMDAEGHWGPACKTGLRTSKPKSSGDKAAMEEVLERVSQAPDDEEAKRELAALTLKQLASISTGRGAQQLRALELISEMAQVGMTPTKGSEEDCPIFNGQVSCPSCGNTHQPAQVFMSDEAMAGLERSLGQLDEIRVSDEELEARQEAADKHHGFTQ